MPTDPRGSDRTALFEERLIDLEVRLAYQDRTLRTLDDVVRTLADRVDALGRQLSARAEIAPPSETP